METRPYYYLNRGESIYKSMVRTTQTQDSIELPEGATPPEEKKPRRRRLRTLADLSRFMGSLINDCRCGDIEPALAARLGYLINIQKSILSEGELEARIQALETELKNR